VIKKAFKDTAIGGFLTRVAPTVIDTVGEAFPPAKLLKGLLDQEQFIAPEDRAKLEELPNFDWEVFTEITGIEKPKETK